jgi:osmoprotectant transport system permease protein
MAYLWQHPLTVGGLLLQHLQIAGLAVVIAIAIALPLGVTMHQYPRLRVPIMGFLTTLYTIPSLALIILLVPIFGLSAQSVIVAMILYSQVILVRNVGVGMESVDAEIVEAAKGMGMNVWQRWWRVQLPLMLPILIAGVRLAMIVTVAIAAIGAKFGAGGLGTLLFEGIQQQNYSKLWAGAIALTVLALSLNFGLRYLEKRFTVQR